MKTAQQRRNLRQALKWWKTVPVVNVAPNLGTWTVPLSDGTKDHAADRGFEGTDHELVTYRLEYELAQG